MSINVRVSVAGAGVAALALFGLTACTSDDSSSDSAAMTTTRSMSTEPMSPTTGAGVGANLVGPGCAEYAAQVPTGPGSVEGMAQEPVAVAASNNPLLTTLTAAVSGKLNPQVNLVDTLNGGEFTIFAPVDEAFAEIDPATIESLKTDTPTLEKILTYHVVPGRIAPNAIAGTQTTVQGGTVTVTGSGDDLKVNDAAVICGGVDTANATVYLIDSVLIPQ
ncbi:fasciclin domain-containing protein [Nocardia sp. NPDC058518]|uniref:fasciclin domain-containing protein n=1 Tax=Nocardia sp. NPDC058518 TaxID=3346534 RepID=UPI00364B6768